MNYVKEHFKELKISLEDIKSTTNDFAKDNCIGRGGFGKVYKGELFHLTGHTTVALKRLDRKFGQGDPEFWKEIVMLSLYKHENIVSLLGFCDDRDEKILMYEYASKKSLNLYLNNSDLTWIPRLKICIGAARGLAYLHNPKGTHQRVLHRDVKSSNILLDENWNARIADFGLSKFGPADQQYTFLFSDVVGTLGYCDPVYVETGVLTKESDVYSFGVVLFEVLCGRLCINNKRQPLTGLVRKFYEEGRIREIIYANIKDEISPDSLKVFITIAYQCLKRDIKDRPLMANVVKELETSLRYQISFSVKASPPLPLPPAAVQPPPPPPPRQSLAVPPPPPPLTRRSLAVPTPPPPPPPPRRSPVVPLSPRRSPAVPPPPPPPPPRRLSPQCSPAVPPPPPPPPPLRRSVVVPPPPPPPPPRRSPTLPPPLPPPPPPPRRSPAIPPPQQSPQLPRRSPATPTTSPALRPDNIESKPADWLKTNATEGSLWGSSEDGLRDLEINIEEVEKMLLASSVSSTSKDGSQKMKPEKIGLVDQQRAINCEILLAKIRIPLSEIFKALLSLDFYAVSTDEVQNLIKCCPSNEEIEMIKGYRGDKQMLGHCEQFFLACTKIPRITRKLHVFAFAITFSSEVKNMKENLNTINKATREIKESTKLAKIMKTILKLANQLNIGTQGSATGFRIASLVDLVHTNVKDTKMTVLNYLCKVVSEQMPELLDFDKDLIHLGAANKIQMEAIDQDMKSLQTGRVNVRMELYASGGDGRLSTQFISASRRLLDRADAQIPPLNSYFKDVVKYADSLPEYFGEDPAHLPWEKVIGSLFRFTRTFKNALGTHIKINRRP